MYQFSNDGNNWTNLGEDLRKADLTPGTTYYIRGVYRGEIASERVEVKTYPIIQLNNSNLEAYSQEGKDGNPFDNYGARFYWVNWATLNELTCDYCPWTAYAYNTRSGTRPVSGSEAYSGTSAWIATIGWGYGGTTGNTKYQTPGELFLGSLTDVNHDKDTATKNYGTSYDSHPTHIKFMYKYIPYENDQSDIYIQILHDDIILGDASLQETATLETYTEGMLTINYDKEIEKMGLLPNRIILVFRSGINNYVNNYGNSGKNGVRFVGSELYIDDISLIYDK